MVKTIDNDDDGVLRKPTHDIQFPLSPKIKEVIASMRKQMEVLKNPAGLAAPQIGYSCRIIIFHVPKLALELRKDAYEVYPLTVLLNPIFEPLGDKKSLDWEDCFSVPGKSGEVYRYEEIEFTGQNEDGTLVKNVAKGFLARLLQHEIDHTKGILYTDRMQAGSRFVNAEEVAKIRETEADIPRISR